MRPKPLLPFVRFFAAGMGVGGAVAVAVVALRGADEGRLGDVAIGLAVGAAAGLALASALLAQLRHAVRRAEPLPDEADVEDGTNEPWLAAVAGLGLPLVAVVRGLNDPAGFAAGLAGLPLGAAVGFAVSAWWLHGWQSQHGCELLQRKRGLRRSRYYVRTSRAA